MGAPADSTASLSEAIGWVYPYLSSYSEMNGVEFLTGSRPGGCSPGESGASDGEEYKGVDRMPSSTLFHPKGKEGVQVREWIEFHMRTLLGVMGPPFDSVLQSGGGDPSRYVALAAAFDAVDEMVYMIGRITPDGRALLFLSEVPLLIKAMDQTVGKQLHAVTRWIDGISRGVRPAS